MSKIVIVLGAGASCEYGLPSMSNFLQISEKLFRDNSNNYYRGIYENVNKAICSLQNVNSKSFVDIYNIEDVFSSFEMGRIIGRLPGMSNGEEIENLIVSTKRLIYETLDKSTLLMIPSRDKPPDAKIGYRRLVEFIKEVNKKSFDTCCVITFNYDLLLDYALYKSNLIPNYCLNTKNEPIQGKVKLIKLHGSLNWLVNLDNKNEIFPVFLNDIFEDVKYYINPYSEDRIFYIDPIKWLSTKNNIYNKKKIIPEPVLIPPVFNKMEYSDNIRNVWRQASIELSDAEYILICGYSHPETDNFFKFLFALGMAGDSLIHRFAVYDPNTELEERYKKILGRSLIGRYLFEDKDFGTFSQELYKLIDEEKKN
jgi:hypothetical protein